MGFPMHKTAGRAALIAVMLGGGLLYAGISQAQDISQGQNPSIQAERGAELIEAVGGPAPVDHLIPFARDKAAVETRDDDVAPLIQPASVTAPTASSDDTAASSSHVAMADVPPPRK